MFFSILSSLGRREPLNVGRFSSRFYSIMGSLKELPGATKNVKRIGRGPSSGKGKTSGRGQKGQKAREGISLWFEGGQTPITKLFPKRGFKNVHAYVYQELSLSRIQEFYDLGRIPLEPRDSTSVLNMKTMVDCGLVTGKIVHGIKILGDGKENYNVPYSIEASKISSEALKAIEATGAKFTAKYFTKLGLRAHLMPEKFLEKYGRLPLEAKPIKRKDIQYYTDANRRGYLTGKMEYPKLTRTKTVVHKKSYMDTLLEELPSESTAFRPSLDSGIVSRQAISL